MSTKVIEMDNIGKKYRDGLREFWAVKNASASFFQNEIVLILGPSGSGKTTLLSIMGSLLHPTCGELVIGGQRISQMTSNEIIKVRQQFFCYVFQHFNLIPSMTALENVLFVGQIKRIPVSYDFAMELLKEVGLENKVNAYPHTLSGGEKQRVGIARAIATNCPVILADEPTSSLDFATAVQIFSLFAEQMEKYHTTIIAVTHDTRLIPYATKVLNIREGCLHEYKE